MYEVRFAHPNFDMIYIYIYKPAEAPDSRTSYDYFVSISILRLVFFFGSFLMLVLAHPNFRRDCIVIVGSCMKLGLRIQILM